MIEFQRKKLNIGHELGQASIPNSRVGQIANRPAATTSGASPTLHAEAERGIGVVEDRTGLDPQSGRGQEWLGVETPDQARAPEFAEAVHPPQLVVMAGMTPERETETQELLERGGLAVITVGMSERDGADPLPGEADAQESPGDLARTQPQIDEQGRAIPNDHRGVAA